jgi:hypothetical protein
MGLLLLATACFLVLGLGLFTHGFLSTRRELPLRGSCAEHDPYLAALGVAACAQRAAPAQKLVILLIDALREDFFWGQKGSGNRGPATSLPRLRDAHLQAVSEVGLSFCPF